MKSCSGKTKAGKPCRAAAGPGGLCYFHANPETAKKLGQIGGTKNRKFTGFDMHVPDNITATDLCKLEVQVVRGLLSGDIPPRESMAVAQIFNLLFRHLPTADLEKRITFLEEASGRVSMPTDGSERDVAENDLQDSPETRVCISDTGSEEAPNTENDNEKEDKDEDP
jgi:hypothetical protein